MGLLNFLTGKEWKSEITIDVTVRNGTVTEYNVEGYSNKDESPFIEQTSRNISKYNNQYPNRDVIIKARSR